MRPRFLKNGCGKQLALAVICLITALAFFTSAQAAAPPVNTPIGNASSATYNDGSGTRTVTSNTVITTVSQVANLSLVASATKTVSPGGTLYFPHTLTNLGNGPDTYTLDAVDVAGGFVPNSIQIYPDLNGDGLPDTGSTPLTLGTTQIPLVAGGVYRFVMVETVPGTATGTNDVTVTATSINFYPGTTTLFNIDTASVLTNANIVINKAISIASGPATTTGIKYTLTYTNTGNTAATALTISDTVPATMTIQANTGTWSVGNQTGLTDATDAVVGTDPTIDYRVAGNLVTVIISKVLPGETREVTFLVNVVTTAPAGQIVNNATFGYNDGSIGQTGKTNDAIFTVIQLPGVQATDVSVGPAASSATDDDATANDVINTAGPVDQGATVPFDVVIVNRGNGTDTFNITVANLGAGVGFPAGTTFQLFKADGVTPLTNTNTGDGVADTGPLAAGAFYHVFVKAILPPGFIPPAVPQANYDATVTATSILGTSLGGTPTDSATIRLGAIKSATVDITNNNALGAGGCTALPLNTCGGGVGPEAAAVTSLNVAPGSEPLAGNLYNSFKLRINNTSGFPDNYDLGAFSTSGGAALPVGLSVLFRLDTSLAGDCSTVGSSITNTGTILNTANLRVCAVVSVPATFAAGTYPIYFKALSPASGALDLKHDEVVITTVRKLVVAPNGTGQIFPGGVKYYSHTVTNAGNVTEGGNLGDVTLATTDTKTGWASIIYPDYNCNGILDTTGAAPVEASTIITDLRTMTNPASPLLAGASACFIIKVQAFAGSGVGDTDVTTVITTPNPLVLINGVAGSANQVTDTTTIIGGSVVMTKTQIKDDNCTNNGGAGYASNLYTSATQAQLPGRCVRYEITALNVGTKNVTDLVINDQTPQGTVYNDGTVVALSALCTANGAPVTGAAPAKADAALINPAGVVAPANIVTGANCTEGNLSFTIPTLIPGQSAVMHFGVFIKNGAVN